MAKRPYRGSAVTADKGTNMTHDEGTGDADRMIPLEGAFNARDAGGLLTADGGRMKRNVLLRMDSPHLLTEADAIELLDNRGVRTILDLRYPEESRTHGIGLLKREDVVHLNVPIKSSDSSVAPGLRQMVDSQPDRPYWEVTFEYYKGYFECNDGAAIVSAISELIRPGTLPALVHCAAGKDRTGVVIATAQSIAGVTNDVIAADYAASAPAVPKIIERLVQSGAYGEISPGDSAQQLTRAETMVALMDWIDTHFGGARAFLSNRGMSDADLDTLVGLLREDEPAR